MTVRLKELRDDAGWSQADLAEAAGGLDPSYISLLERGLRKITIYRGMAIADALSKKLGRPISVSDVFGTGPDQGRNAVASTVPKEVAG